jgi:hypothetical protein
MLRPLGAVSNTLTSFVAMSRSVQRCCREALLCSWLMIIVANQKLLLFEIGHCTSDLVTGRPRVLVQWRGHTINQLDRGTDHPRPQPQREALGTTDSKGSGGHRGGRIGPPVWRREFPADFPLQFSMGVFEFSNL